MRGGRLKVQWKNQLQKLKQTGKPSGTNTPERIKSGRSRAEVVLAK
jgi:hypothetical protein